MDCALHKAGVTFVLDRAGITGPDGASHNGMWDMTITCVVPGLRLAAPRDGQQVATRCARPLDIADAPDGVRFPKGAVADPVLAVRTVRRRRRARRERRGRRRPARSSASASIAGRAHRPPRSSPPQGVRSASSTRSGPCPSATTSWRSPAGPRRVAVVEDNLVCGGVGSQVDAGPARRRHRRAGARPRHPQASSSTTALAARCSTGPGSRRMPSPVASARGWAESTVRPAGRPATATARCGQPGRRRWTLVRLVHGRGTDASGATRAVGGRARSLRGLGGRAVAGRLARARAGDG